MVCDTGRNGFVIGQGATHPTVYRKALAAPANSRIGSVACLLVPTNKTCLPEATISGLLSQPARQFIGLPRLMMEIPCLLS